MPKELVIEKVQFILNVDDAVVFDLKDREEYWVITKENLRIKDDGILCGILENGNLVKHELLTYGMIDRVITHFDFMYEVLGV